LMLRTSWRKPLANRLDYCPGIHTVQSSAAAGGVLTRPSLESYEQQPRDITLSAWHRRIVASLASLIPSTITQDLTYSKPPTLLHIRHNSSIIIKDTLRTALSLHRTIPRSFLSRV
jgi:hypothetical protein